MRRGSESSRGRHQGFQDYLEFLHMERESSESWRSERGRGGMRGIPRGRRTLERERERAEQEIVDKMGKNPVSPPSSSWCLVDLQAALLNREYTFMRFFDIPSPSFSASPKSKPLGYEPDVSAFMEIEVKFFFFFFFLKKKERKK